MVTENNYGPYLPVRTQVGNRKVGNYWEAFSLKAGRVVHFDSDLEYFFWILLESDSRVSALCEQPLRIAARLDGNWVTSIPDIWYRANDGTEFFCEVKYTKQIQDAAPGSPIDRQLRVQLAWAQQQGIRYCIATDRTILQQPQLISNWAYLLRFLDMKRSGIDLDLGRRICLAVASCQRLTLAEIEGMFSEEGSETLRASLVKELHAGNLYAPDLARQRVTGATVFFSAK